MLIKRNFFSLTVLLFIAGCRNVPVSSIPTRTIAKPACTSAGMVQTATIAPHVEIVVYLPPCYEPQTKNAYPVLYLLPGFSGTAHEWFDSGVQATADTAIMNGDIAPFIIAATPDTFDDLDSHVVYETILPYIENHYPVAKDRRYRAVAGGSYGGAAAYHLAFKHPDLYSSAGIFGNGAALGEEDYIRDWLAAIPKNIRPRVFLNVGQSDSYMLQRAQVLVPILNAIDISHVDIFSAGGHDYGYWLSNFPAFFKFLAQDWR